jgi:hypothetical protein
MTVADTLFPRSTALITRRRGIYLGERSGALEHGGSFAFIGLFSLLDLPLTVVSNTIRVPD